MQVFSLLPCKHAHISTRTGSKLRYSAPLQGICGSKSSPYLNKEGPVPLLVQGRHEDVRVHCSDELIKLCASNRHQHIARHLSRCLPSAHCL